MSSLVTMDFGNSRAKAALFHLKREQVELKEEFEAEEMESVLAKFNLNVTDVPAILCQVKKYPHIIQSLLEKGMLIENISDSWKGKAFDGMKVSYAPTIGLDRLIGAHYAYHQLKQKALVIDAGTFLTIDVVTHDGFLGGYIIPGITKFNKIFSDGENLFEPSASLPLSTEELPHTTEDAITGFMISIKLLIKKWITHYQLESIVLTGGEAPLMRKIVQEFGDQIKIEEQPHYLHWAMMNWWKRQGHL